MALTNATLPYALEIAKYGILALSRNEALQSGVNTMRGAVTHPAVAKDLGYTFVPVEQAV
jgi:alanine dehydrogenase